VDPLDGVDLKLKQASKHLACLDIEVRALVGDGRPIVGYFDSDTSEYVFRVDSEPPPIEWGVTLSELVHLLRSSLDNLFWQLLVKRLRAEPAPRKRESFPIHKTKDGYKGDLEPWVNKLTTDDRALIEEAQPFKAPKPWHQRHPLALLNDLNNIDKHRFFHIGYIGEGIHAYDPHFKLMREIPPHADSFEFTKSMIQPGGQIPTFALAFPLVSIQQDVAEQGKTMFTGGKANDRTEIMRVQVVPSGPDPKMKMQPTRPPSISLGDPELPVTIADLGLVLSVVREVVNRAMRGQMYLLSRDKRGYFP
jgi:hypothetical protein